MSAAPIRGGATLSAARDAVTLGSSLAVTTAVAFVVRMLVPRVLGPEAFGEYRLAEATAEILFVVLTFGVDLQMRREAALDPSRARGYLSGLTVLRVAVGMLGIAVIAAVLRAAGSGEAVLWLFSLIAAWQVLLVLNNSYAAFEHAAGDVGWIARVNVGTKVLWAAAVVGVLAAWPAGIAVAAVGLAVEALRFVWLTARGARRHGWALRPDMRLAWAAILASVPFFVNLVAHSLYARIGTGWVAASATDAEVGLYGAAGNLASIALLGMPLLFWVLVPAAARADAGAPGEMDGLVASALRVSFLVTVPIAVVSYLGAGTWLRLLFGEAYAPAAPVLQILTPTFVLTYASTISAIALIQRGRIWTVAAVSVTGVVTTVLLAAILVPWGARSLGTAGAAQGAAWATLATEAAVALALGWAYGSGWRNRALWRTIAAVAGGVVAAAAATALLPGSAVFPVAALAFAAVVVIAGGVDRDDMRFCRQAIGRPRGRLALSTVGEAS